MTDDRGEEKRRIVIELHEWYELTQKRLGDIEINYEYFKNTKSF